MSCLSYALCTPTVYLADQIDVSSRSVASLKDKQHHYRALSRVNHFVNLIHDKNGKYLCCCERNCQWQFFFCFYVGIVRDRYEAGNQCQCSAIGYRHRWYPSGSNKVTPLAVMRKLIRLITAGVAIAAMVLLVSRLDRRVGNSRPRLAGRVARALPSHGKLPERATNDSIVNQRLHVVEVQIQNFCLRYTHTYYYLRRVRAYL